MTKQSKGFKWGLVVLVVAGILFYTGATEQLTAGTGPGVDVTREIVTSWVETHDLAYTTENVVFVDMTTGDEIRGREALGEFLDWFWHVAFDADLEAVVASAQYTVGNGESAVEFTAFGTHTGEFAGIAPTGNRVEFPIAITYEHEQGWPYRIERARIYIMMNVLMAQLGQ